MIVVPWLGIAAPVWLVFLISLPIGIFGVARLGRALTNDDFPPSVWFRRTWHKITNDGPWAMLSDCLWCLPFWLAVIAVGWFVAGIFVTWLLVAWWIVWLCFAIGYLASIIIRHDEPEEH